MPDLSSLFDPKGIIITGVSNHPGKFGFVTLHNLLSSGYEGRVFPVSREPGAVLGLDVLGSIDDVPDGAADMVFICTPPAINEELLRRAAAKGVTAAFCAAGGYREAGPEGAEAETRLIDLCRELGIALAGPNGQGVVSTPAKMCAQIVAPYAPAGKIAIASQSGNFVSSFLNLANHTGVGVSRAVAAGNASVLGIADYLEYFTDDPETAVSLVYIESVEDGREMFDRMLPLSGRKPIVVVKGGASAAGARAAASHTGALASDDAVFDGMCRQAGLIRAKDVEEAFEAAATFASQPLPSGDRVVVVTTVGGWGVAAVDAMADTRLDPIPLPDDLLAAIDAKLQEKRDRESRALADQAERQMLKDMIGADIDEWLRVNQNNVRTMLANLGDVLWQNHGYKSPSMNDLLNPPSVKKCYHRALILIHPDKVRQRGGDTSMIYIADKVFDQVRDAYKAFEAKEM